MPQRVSPVVIAVCPLKLENDFCQEAAGGKQESRQQVADPRAFGWVTVATNAALINLE